MDDLQKLWNLHINHKDRQAREALILRYTPLVKYVAGRLAFRLPPSLEPDDLISYGVMGLIEAVDRFSLSYDVKFETFAVSRIRGQIIDSLRAIDLLPRSSYRYAKEIEEAIAELSQTMGQTPADADVAAHLNLSLEDYHARLQDATCVIVSLDQLMTYSNGEQGSLHDSLEDERMATPSEEIDEKELKTQLINALGDLPERERLLVSLYYNDGLTMKEVGQVLGVSESRVSQMHARTMLTLRGLINRNAPSGSANHHARGSYASVFAVTG